MMTFYASNFLTADSFTRTFSSNFLVVYSHQSSPISIILSPLGNVKKLKHIFNFDKIRQNCENLEIILWIKIFKMFSTHYLYSHTYYL